MEIGAVLHGVPGGQQESVSSQLFLLLQELKSIKSVGITTK